MKRHAWLLIWVVLAARASAISPTIGGDLIAPADVNLPAHFIEDPLARRSHSTMFRYGRFRQSIVWAGPRFFRDGPDAPWKQIRAQLRKDGTDDVADALPFLVRVTDAGKRECPAGSGACLMLTTRDGTAGIAYLIPERRGIHANRRRIPFALDGLECGYDIAPNTVRLGCTVPTRRGPHVYTFPYVPLGTATPFIAQPDGSVRNGQWVIPAPTIRRADGMTERAGAWEIIADPPALRFAFDDTTIPDAGLPYVIDPDTIYGDTADGGVLGDANAYADARATATDVHSGDSIRGPENSQPSPTEFHVERVFWKFNTATIPDVDTVTAVVMSLAVAGVYKDGGTDYTPVIYKYDWSASDPISTGNKETVYDGCAGADVDGNWRTTAGVTENTYYDSAALTAAWINKTGYTYYCVRVPNDISNTAPSGSGQHQLIQFYTAESAYPPYLTITHEDQSDTPTPSNTPAATSTPTITATPANTSTPTATGSTTPVPTNTTAAATPTRTLRTCD